MWNGHTSYNLECTFLPWCRNSKYSWLVHYPWFVIISPVIIGSEVAIGAIHTGCFPVNLQMRKASKYVVNIHLKSAIKFTHCFVKTPICWSWKITYQSPIDQSRVVLNIYMYSYQELWPYLFNSLQWRHTHAQSAHLIIARVAPLRWRVYPSLQWVKWIGHSSKLGMSFDNSYNVILIM